MSARRNSAALDLDRNEEELQEVNERLARYRQRFESEIVPGILRVLPKTIHPDDPQNGLELNGAVLARRQKEILDLRKDIRMTENRISGAGENNEALKQELSEERELLKHKNAEYLQVLHTFRGFFTSLVENHIYDELNLSEDKIKDQIQFCLNYYSLRIEDEEARKRLMAKRDYLTDQLERSGRES